MNYSLCGGRFLRIRMFHVNFTSRKVYAPRFGLTITINDFILLSKAVDSHSSLWRRVFVRKPVPLKPKNGKEILQVSISTQKSSRKQMEIVWLQTLDDPWHKSRCFLNPHMWSRRERDTRDGDWRWVLTINYEHGDRPEKSISVTVNRESP